MQEQEKFRQIGFGGSIVVLLGNFLYAFVEWAQFSDIYNVLILGFVGITAILLGLFKFHKGLSFGLVMGGIIATYHAWLHYHFQLTDFLKFVTTLIVLSLLCFALYRLVKKNNK